MRQYAGRLSMATPLAVALVAAWGHWSLVGPDGAPLAAGH